MRRRQLLKLGPPVGAIGLLAGCSALFGEDEREEGTPTGSLAPPEQILDAPTTLHGVTFETVLDVVEDLGMDPNGEEPIDDALDEGYGDKTLLAFQPGEYLATDEHRYEEPVTGFGMVGLGESQNDVQFVFPEGNEGAPDPNNYRFLSFRAGRDIVVQNLTFQMTDDKVTGVETVFTPEDGLWIVDVEFAGFMPKEAVAPSNNLIVHITTRDGVGVIRRFVFTGGGVVDTYPSRGTPIGIFRSHRGELRIENAHIEESGSHSIYAARMQGCVRVEGGLFRNNDNTNLRISGGGHPNKRSWIKNARVEIDVDEAEHLPNGEHYQGIRGIWVEAGGESAPGYGGLLIENLDAVIRSNGSASDLPLLLVDTTHGSVTVRNSRFRSFVEEVEPVDIRNPASFVDEPHKVVIEDSVIETTARRVIDEEAALSITGRPNSEIRDSTIRLVDGWVDGIYAEDADRLTVRNTAIQSRTRDRSTSSRSSGSFGWNDGVVIVDSNDCELVDLFINVPGAPTKYQNSGVNETKITWVRPGNSISRRWGG